MHQNMSSNSSKQNKQHTSHPEKKLDFRYTKAFSTPTIAKKYAEINTIWNSIVRFQNIYLRTKKFA